jgi:Hint domain
MKRLTHFGTRRQLFKAIVAGGASVPFLALAKKSASAQPAPPPPPGGGPPPPPGGGPPPGRTACLLKGTKISTPSGDRLVQELKIGDEVNTLAGRRPIKWIAYSKFTKEEGRAWPDSVMPIRVARFAINDRSPHSDLYLSPLHRVFFNEALIQANYLVNGTSFAQGAPSDTSTIEYYHIEFEMHEVIYAEGALVESFLYRDSNREGFSNFVEYERLYGAEPQSEMTPFAPILEYRTRREKIEGIARLLISNVVDVRHPVHIAHDQIARRAEGMLV